MYLGGKKRKPGAASLVCPGTCSTGPTEHLVKQFPFPACCLGLRLFKQSIPRSRHLADGVHSEGMLITSPE